ncbi:sugar ABC transporter substrate-binding protein [Sphingobium sp.]|uniref:sugar ABC transporter substrate-binding protein n=1 Tax=Sphingobium sp. TaxID=1912891 RepID=UPI0028BF3D8C|nr:sugar ABC transporter substrate-binding protein [Sphingobium sp.]
MSLFERVRIVKPLKFSIAIALAMTPLLASCGNPKPLEDKSRDTAYSSFKGRTVAFLPILFANDLAQGWYAGMKSELEPLGVRLEVRDANLSTSVGAQAFTRLIIEKPDVIVVQNPDLSAYVRLIQRAEREGIHVIQVNMQSSAGSAGFVGPDWVEIGRRQANAAIDACKARSGKIAIVQGSLTSAANAYSMQGIRAVLQGHPGIKIVSNQAAEWDTSKAKSITQAVLRQNPDLCAVLGSYDGMDLGEAAAIKEAGLTGKVALITSGGGSRQGACDQVKNGTFTTYFAYDVPTQAQQINTIVKLLLSSGAKPGTLKSVTYTPLRRITASSADQPGMCWSQIY